MNLRSNCVISVILLYLIKSLSADGMIEVFKWKQMDYYNRGNQMMTSSEIAYNSAQDNKSKSGVIYFPGQYYGARSKRQTDNSSYIPYNNVPMGASQYKGRLFVTMPRRRLGIPSTLNYIDLKKDGGQESPKLTAYPDFETNQLTSKSPHLVSVYRTSIDSCGRLWFIDTGMLEYPNNFMQIQNPSIWLIDLHTDKVIRRFEIPDSIVDEGRGLASIEPDTDSGCDKAFAYIPDLVNNRLYVYSFEANKMWSFDHNYFHFDPIAGDFDIGGQFFRWNDGIFSISLGPQEGDGSRNILFHAMASTNEFVINNKLLQNESVTLSNYQGMDLRLLGNRGNQKQSTMHAYDPRTGVVFYAEIQRNGVGCWNKKNLFTAANHGQVAKDEQTMIYPSDLTIDEDGTIWVMTNSMPIFIYSTLDANKFNFRVWKQDTVKAVQNTVCD